MVDWLAANELVCWWVMRGAPLPRANSTSSTHLSSLIPLHAPCSASLIYKEKTSTALMKENEQQERLIEERDWWNGGVAARQPHNQLRESIQFIEWEQRQQQFKPFHFSFFNNSTIFPFLSSFNPLFWNGNGREVKVDLKKESKWRGWAEGRN